MANSVIETLASNIIFSTLTSKELQYVSGMVYDRVYQPQEKVFEKNDRGFGLYVIASGRVGIRSGQSDADTLITVLEKGSFFGELALVDPTNTRTATALALERSELIGFFKPDFSEMMTKKPEIGVKILYQVATVIGKRLTETTEKLALLSQARGMGNIRAEFI